MICDIFITTKDRPKLLARSLESFRSCTSKQDYRLTIVQDGMNSIVDEVIGENIDIVDYLILNKTNEGLGPSINRALSHIFSTNDWFSDPRVPEEKESALGLICYCQDDLLYTPNWLQRLAKAFMVLEKMHRLGFASGIECIEHPRKSVLPNGMVLKDWIRAAQMLGRREYWQSMFPIPRFDPETGHVRAKPNDGIGSGVDWHFIRNHANSICRTNRTCLVMPGLVKHLGYKESTWLNRELPESDSDKKEIESEIAT